MSDNSKIEKVWEAINFAGKARLIKHVKLAYPDIKTKAITDWLEKNETYQQTKTQPKPQKYQRNPDYKEGHVVSTQEHELWNLDIFDLSKYAKANDGYKYLFVVIDVFTRIVDAVPMKTKSSEECTKAFASIRKNSGKGVPRAILLDQDSAMTKPESKFFKYCFDNEIAQDTNALKDHKAMGIIDNYAKQLKSTLSRLFLQRKSLKWIDKLDDLIDVRNNMPNQALGGIKPVDVDEGDNDMIVRGINLDKKMDNKMTSDLSEGDLVRRNVLMSIANPKKTEPKWSEKVYKVLKAVGNTVYLDNDQKYKRTDLLKVPSGSQTLPKNVVTKLRKERRDEIRAKNPLVKEARMAKLKAWQAEQKKKREEEERKRKEEEEAKAREAAASPKPRLDSEANIAKRLRELHPTWSESSIRLQTQMWYRLHPGRKGPDPRF